MDNEAVQRGQTVNPGWGPPPKRRTNIGGGPAVLAPSSGPASGSTLTTPPPPGSETLPPEAASWAPPTTQSPTPDAVLAARGPIPFWLAAVAATAAVLLELAVTSRLNSLAFALATGIMAGMVLAHRARRTRSGAAYTVLANVGGVVLVLRASPWVTVPTVLMVGGCLVLAGQGGPVGGNPITAGLNHLADTAASIRWLARPLAGRRGGRSVIGSSVMLAALAVVPLALLLASADAAFGQLLSNIGTGSGWSHLLLSALILPFVVALAVAARRSDRPVALPSRPAGPSPTGRFSMIEGTAVLGSVALLLTVWGATQIVVALGGADRLLATADLTAAENARRGFFQLVAATAFLLALVVSVDRSVDRVTARDRRRFLALTVLIGGQTLGVVAATYSRLSLYISGFGTTMLRTSVAWFLAWLAAVMVVAVVAVNRPDFRGRFGPALFALVSLWVIGFGLWNPEASVAATNLGRDTIDVRYLVQDLSTDATPTIVDRVQSLDAASRMAVTEELCRELTGRGSDPDQGSGYGPLSWNRSDAQAARAVRTLNC